MKHPIWLLLGTLLAFEVLWGCVSQNDQRMPIDSKVSRDVLPVDQKSQGDALWAAAKEGDIAKTQMILKEMVRL